MVRHQTNGEGNVKEGPDIARIGSLIGDPGRANMLSALMSGKALTAGELASEAGVLLQTASGHLAKMEEGGLIRRNRQGRHHYFVLADEDVAGVLEALMGLAAKRGQLRTRTGPRDPEMRFARVCYNHLAGDLGVALFDALKRDKVLRLGVDGLELTPTGKQHLSTVGIQVDPKGRAPLCRECLDWSERRSHLAGRLGRAILDHLYNEGWAKRIADSRVVSFNTKGLVEFKAAFRIS